MCTVFISMVSLCPLKRMDCTGNTEYYTYGRINRQFWRHCFKQIIAEITELGRKFFKKRKKPTR